MKQFSKSICSLILVAAFSLPAFTQKIDGKYPAFEALYYASYDNLNKVEADYIPLFKAAEAEANDVTDELERKIRLAWANYIFGCAYASLEDLDTTEKYADIAEAFAKEAVAIKETEDSLLIYANTIGLNCMIKPMSYMLSNGVNINPMAKKIIKMNPKNGRAVFLRDSQDIYGPAIVANYKRGLQEMKTLLEDDTLESSDQLRFDVCCAAAVALFKLKRQEEAKAYMQEAGRLFPNNISYVKTMAYLEQ